LRKKTIFPQKKSARKNDDIFLQELNLNLYRHWSLYESLRHTIYTAAKFRIWLNKGKQRLSEFLAELGLPLVRII
jgi:cell division control protein 45